MTDNKKTKERFISAALNSERRYASFLETIFYGIQENDTAGIITYSNAAHHRMLGYAEGELIGKTIWDILPTESERDELRAYLAMLVKNQPPPTPYIGKSRRKNGSLIDTQVDWNYVRDDHGSLTGFISVITDISERKLTENALRESEERFRGAFNSAAHGISLVAPDGRWMKVNSSLCTILGYTEEELLATNFQTITHPDDLDADLQFVQKLLAGEIPSYQMEKRYFHKRGHTIWILLSVSVVKDTKGTPLYFVSQVQDVSESKRAEESLRRNKKALENAQRIAHLGQWAWDINADRVTLSEDLFRLFGLQTREYISYEDFLGIIHPDDVAIMKKTVEGAIYQSKSFRAEYRIMRPDGTEKAFHSEGEVYDDNAGNPISMFGIAQDITERKKLEAQLLQAQKMEAVGQLAGGIAHDFNNILTAIMGYGNILQMRMGKDGPLRPQVDNIIASAERAALLTHSLLAFSRKQVILPAPVGVNGIVTRVLKLLAHLIGEDIDIKKVLSDEEIIVMADAGQIEHVLMNLATNARDAMPGGGTLIIGTRPAELDDEYVKAHGYGAPGHYAVLSITDGGIGMDEMTKDRIFEPFFTTKESGRGTGLGLAMVYGIIKQHGGHITVYSEPEKGTTFTIYLPRITSEAIAEQPEEASTPPGGTETILVGEDDAALRSLARTVLEDFGYTVIMAEDGEDAVRQFKEHAETIQLLLLDVIMPGKNGKEAYEEIRNVKPDVKVLFTSGYTADLIQKKGILDGDINLVYKPVSPTELLIKIREVLDQ
ncbi:MAG TPA: hybrid sensor histidine kinase/response regulator [Nitrospiraceae bacterium]|nr:hybrid sensor histidine kinase/response regulator [Nitrospiraceae bacterium]